jgi:pimeloyl-ACP methyl ester carboxylesterase
VTAIWKSEAGAEAVRRRYAAFLERWPVANVARRVATSQGETFVVACGPPEAPPVLLLHGSAANSASWMGDVAAWAQRFRVYAVDMIGEPGFSAPNRPPLASRVYAGWLGEVMDALGVRSAALVGISLGGWLALEFATRHPERVSALALLCPGGVGKHRNVLLWAGPLLLLGPWGRRQIGARIRGPAPPGEPSPEVKAFGEFMDLIFANYRPRTERLPPFDDAALQRLTMPLLAILGGKDVFIDSAGTQARITANVPEAEIEWLPEAGHLLVGHTARIGAFLAGTVEPRVQH